MASLHEPLSVKDLKDIQAGPVVSIPTKSICFLFFGIKDVGKFRQLFGRHVLPNITTSDVARNIKEEVVGYKKSGKMKDLAAITISFSQTGLNQLLPNADTKDASFQGGQRKQAQALGDDEKNWLPNFKGNPIHGLVEVTGNPTAHIQKTMRDKVKNALGDSITVIFEHCGEVRPGKQKGHEHFGYNDGIAQPFVKFEDDDDKRKPRPGQTTVDPGVLVLGRKGDPSLIDRPPWAVLGSFVVYRHLQQKVPEFDKFLKDAILESIITVKPVPDGLTDSEDFMKRVDFLGARLVGRWKSGLPVVLTAKEPGKFPTDKPEIGGNPELNNDFDYGPRNSAPAVREQFLCPFAAHTRKTGPRTDLPQPAIEAHAIQRAGITFGPEVTPDEKRQMKTLKQRGLSFVSYQSSLAAGFEFIQRSWANKPSFPPRTGDIAPGFDLIVGQAGGKEREMTGSDADRLDKVLKAADEFVVSQGGEYFFLPSVPTLKIIAGAAASS